MKLSNLLQLTEHHRFAVVRRFGLSSLDQAMIYKAYQPMVGSVAVSIYMTLFTELPPEKVGMSRSAPFVQLFLACGLEPNEQGRKRLMEETSKLEAVGLLRSYQRAEEDELVEYEFHLAPPLPPDEFFNVHHLWLLLKEKLGNGAKAIRQSFFQDSMDEQTELKDISAPFYEVFRIAVGAASEEEMRKETAAAVPPTESFGRDGFRCDELLRRFPRSSANRPYVERFQTESPRLAELNYYAGRFGLTLKQTVSLLDEEQMFTSAGELDTERFQTRAAALYRQTEDREQGKERLRLKKQQLADGESAASGNESSAVPAAAREVKEMYWLVVPEQFQGMFEADRYNHMLANDPYVKVLKLFFQPSSVPRAVEEAFLAMYANYKLPDEVLNVLIHYIRVNDLDWSPKFLDAIAANVAGKRIRTFENATAYFRKAEQVRKGGAAQQGKLREGNTDANAPERKPRTAKARAQKPVIPVARGPEKKAATAEDLLRIMEKARQVAKGTSE